MPKIKDIHDRLLKNSAEYTEIRLLIAKRTLAFFIAFYYVSFLFTIGGFEFWLFTLPVLSQINFHAYTILVIVLAWFIYELVVYAVHIYIPGKTFFIIAALAFSTVFTLFSLYSHFI